MRGARKELPPLDLLVAFEAAARCSSFTAAARELNLTQAAISRQVRLLEEDLGAQLFIRGHRSVALTEQGRRYLPTVALALDQLADASREIRRPDTGEAIKIAATNSVSALWLTPRIKAYQDEHDDCSVQLRSTDIDAECLTEEFDFAILRGEGIWDGYQAERLLDEEIFPVCSPGYRAENPSLGVLDDLVEHSLIDVVPDHDEWMDWRNWLAAVGVTLPVENRQFMVNTYPIAVQAACDGLGIALGWKHLTDDEIEDGKLVRPFAESVKTTSGYFLLVRKDRSPPDHVVSFRDWLFGSVAQG